jgi:hypothetical protein
MIVVVHRVWPQGSPSLTKAWATPRNQPILEVPGGARLVAPSTNIFNAAQLDTQNNSAFGANAGQEDAFVLAGKLFSRPQSSASLSPDLR